MPALCDVNVLLALVTDRHALHSLAARWTDSVPAGEAVVCRVAQMGLLRLLNNPAVMGDEVLDTAGCWSLWRRLLEDERFRFASEEPPGLDAAFERFTTGRAFSPRLWTDAYLAAYAHAARLTLVTLDKGFRGFSGLACDFSKPEPDDRHVLTAASRHGLSERHEPPSIPLVDVVRLGVRGMAGPHCLVAVLTLPWPPIPVRKRTMRRG